MEGTSGSQTITIIGAGPIGIEAALYAHQCGYDVRVLEKNTVGANIRQWQHVRMFSPFRLNHSPLGVQLLTEENLELPEAEEYLTGEEYLNAYLYPLAEVVRKRVHIETDREVVAISRQRTLKDDYIGDPRRQDFQFRILVRSAKGNEYIYNSDYVIDASGTYGNHNWMGDGGIPALGELANQHHIEYGLPDIAGAERSIYIGKVNLVVGSGHSSGSTIAAFKQLLEQDPATEVIWVTREDRELPLIAIPDDPLAERLRIGNEANEMIRHPRIRWIKNAVIHSIERNAANRKLQVQIDTPAGMEEASVDNIIANVGYSPDNSAYRELQVHECYASRGPMKLSALLLKESSQDCLAQSSQGPETLQNPEPNFYIIGMKSYGKNSNFLLKVGYEQIQDVFRLISGDNDLNLYRRKTTANLMEVQ